jgi:hypothetical protein
MNNTELSLKSIYLNTILTLLNLVYPKMMALCPPSDQVKIKGAPKGGTKAATKKSSYSHAK